jgi:hypothetical protein
MSNKNMYFFYVVNVNVKIRFHANALGTLYHLLISERVPYIVTIYSKLS